MTWIRGVFLSTLLLSALLVAAAIDRAGASGRSISVRDLSNGAAPGRELPERVTLVAYNIAHGRGAATAASNFAGGSAQERVARLGTIAALLRDQNADVVALNEVDFDAVWSDGLNQAEELAHLAGYPYLVEQRNFDVGLGPFALRFGNAILSHYPISNCRKVGLPAYSRIETLLVGRKRGAICTIGDRFRLVALHLDPRSEELRIESARVLNRLAEEEQLPIVLAGDVNSTRGGFPQAERGAAGLTAIDILTQTYSGPPLFGTSDARLASQLTFPSQAPHACIDWILSDQLAVTDRFVLPGLHSDHLAVRAVLTSPRPIQDGDI